MLHFFQLFSLLSFPLSTPSSTQKSITHSISLCNFPMVRPHKHDDSSDIMPRVEADARNLLYLWFTASRECDVQALPEVFEEPGNENYFWRVVDVTKSCRREYLDGEGII